MSIGTSITRWALLFMVAFAAYPTWLTGYASTLDDVGCVASRIRKAVIQEDKSQFIRFFADTSYLSDGDFAYYFGTVRPSALRKFLGKPNIKSRIFFAEVGDDGKEIATVVYFDASVVQEPAALDWNKIGEGWLEKYAAVDLVLIGGKWYFDKTPFFFFRHAPWAGDYG